jgi:hypothetical protein
VSEAPQTLAELEALELAEEAAEASARAAQYEADRLAMYALGKARGFKVHHSAQVRQYVRGLPVVVGVRAPDAAEYKRFFQQVQRAGNADAKIAAHALLAEACWVYPEDKPTRDAMLAANGGLLASVGNFAAALAEVELKEQGKG